MLTWQDFRIVSPSFIEWQAPGWAGSVRVWGAWVHYVNGGASPRRPLVAGLVRGQTLWALQLEEVAAADIGQFWLEVGQHAYFTWLEGTERRQTLGVPDIPAISPDERASITVSGFSGDTLFGQVLIEFTPAPKP